MSMLNPAPHDVQRSTNISTDLIRTLAIDTQRKRNKTKKKRKRKKKNERNGRDAIHNLSACEEERLTIKFAIQYIEDNFEKKKLIRIINYEFA